MNKHMSLFERVSDQLLSFEQKLESARELFQAGNEEATVSSFDLANRDIAQPLQLLQQRANLPSAKDLAFSSVIDGFKETIQTLRHNIGQLNLLYEIGNQSSASLSLEEGIAAALELVWQKAPLTFAVIILGEDELGPYHYEGMMGVTEKWRYLRGECPFPLSGVLSRALLNRLDPTEADYLYIQDIEAEGRPLPDEFPWMTLRGSLLVLPLRLHKVTIGALVLGRQDVNAFEDAELRNDFYEISLGIAKSIHHARMQNEVNKNVEQLVNVQLLTREIARAQTFDAVINRLTQGIPELMGAMSIQVFIQKHKLLDDLPVALLSADEPASTKLDASTEALFYLFETDTESLPTTSSTLQLVAWSMESGEAIFYDPEAMGEHPEYSYYIDSGSAMIVPLMAGDDALGAIRIQACDHLARFDESDMFAFRTIANSVWLALKHVCSLEEQREQQLVDLLRDIPTPD